jgi:hypothetical protein
MANNPKHIENLIAFKKGQTGNPNGRPKKLPELGVLMAEVLGEEKNGMPAAKAILMALGAKAKKGDIRAAEVLLNRGYGLPKQSITNNNEKNVIIRVIRDPNA